MPGPYILQSNAAMWALSIVVVLQELWRGEVKQLSWSPRAFLLKGFLSEEECDYLVGKARLSPMGIQLVSSAAMAASIARLVPSFQALCTAVVRGPQA